MEAVRLDVPDLSELLKTERQGKVLMVVICIPAPKDVISDLVQRETPNNGSPALTVVKLKLKLNSSQTQKDIISDSVQRVTPDDGSPEPEETEVSGPSDVW